MELDWGHLLQIRDGFVRSWARIPYGSHNAQPFRGGVLLNQTEAQVITFWTGEIGFGGRRLESRPWIQRN